MHNRHNEGQTGCVHGVDEDCLEQGVQGRLGMLVRVGDGQQERLDQLLNLRITNHTANLQDPNQCNSR